MLTAGSICAGMGGLEMGISEVIPLTLRWVAEYEPPTEKNPNPRQAAAQLLAHRHPTVPNLGDITTVNWSRTPHVDVICGGTPCQDMSAAGLRSGMRAGTRSGIWASMVEAIATHRPALVVWENVRGALSARADSSVESCPICMGDERECNLRALGRVLGDLADLGYDAAWCGLRAADVGAPHARYRIFVLAWPAEDPDRTASGQRRQPAPGQTPAPTELSTRGGQRLAPQFVEWMMGVPTGWVTAVPGVSRNDQLKILGNGVVPQQAAEAIRRLMPYAPVWVREHIGWETVEPYSPVA